MKLAEALSLRADLQKKQKQLLTRLENNIIVSEDEEAIEDPQKLIKELNGVSQQLEDLIYQINKTNLLTVVDGQSITQLMAHRDVEAHRIDILRQTLREVSERRCNAYDNRKMRATMDVNALRQMVDEAASDYRKLNLKLQELNWTTVLVQ